MRFLKRGILAGASLSLVYAATPPAAGVGGGPTGEPPVADPPPRSQEVAGVPDVVIPASGITEDARADLLEIARDEGITISEAMSQYGWHEGFAKVVHEVRLAHPDSFAGARIEDKGPWIAFKDEPPDTAVSLLKGFSREIEVRANRRYSEAELDERLIQTHYAVLASDQVADAESGYDIGTGEITINVVPRDSSSSDSLAVSLGDRISFDPDMPTRLSTVSEIRSENHAVYGGASLGSCTSGFSVRRRSDGVYGISTAGHCPNDMNFRGNPVLAYKDEHQGAWGDMQWHSSSERTVDDFLADADDYRDVAREGFPVEGQILFRYGINTGRRWDDVYQLNHCNGSRCRLALMDTNEAGPGDSGGPWYYGNTAYGLHQGEKFYWGAKDLFTPVSYLEEMGVSVITSPQP